MKHTVHKSDNNSGCGPIIFTFLFIAFLVFIPVSYVWADRDFYKSAEQLQSILKNECGMDYSIDVIRRNGENLSLICGQDKATD